MADKQVKVDSEKQFREDVLKEFNLSDEGQLFRRAMDHIAYISDNMKGKCDFDAWNMFLDKRLNKGSVNRGNVHREELSKIHDDYMNRLYPQYNTHEKYMKHLEEKSR